MAWLAIAVVRFYQVALRRLVGRNCLFEPTCSEYAIEALRAHGFWRGLVLARRRIRSCRQPARLAWSLDDAGNREILCVTPPDGADWTTLPQRLLPARERGGIDGSVDRGADPGRGGRDGRLVEEANDDR